MKMIIKALLAATVAMSGISAANAVTTVTFDAGGATLPVGINILQNFDGFSSGQLIGPNTFVFGSNQSNAARPAFGSTGNFAAILQGGSYSLNFNPANALSFVIGSLDTFNTVTLRYEDGSSAVYNGGAIVNDPAFDSGNQTSSETNGVVTYRVTSGALLSGITFSSATGSSFEFDNVGVSSINAAVPETATWAMMIAGFGMIGTAMRTRRRSIKVSFA